MSRLINTLSEIDDKFINEANPYKNGYENNGQVAETFAKEDDQKVTKIGRRLPKIAVAAIAFACVLVLGGGVVWAMTASPLKDYLFKNSDKEFEQVYTEVGKEYIFGNHKVVYEGSSYEEAVGQGYLSFSFWDLDGKPMNKQNILINASKEKRGIDVRSQLSKNITLIRHTFSDFLNLDGDEAYLITLYSDNLHIMLDENNMYVKFSRVDLSEDYVEKYKDKPFCFMLLNKEQFDELKNEIGELEAKVEAKELLTYSFEKDDETGLENRPVRYFDMDYVQPELMELLQKYDLSRVESITSEPQVIWINNAKMTIGRMDMTIIYNVNDCTLKDFSIRRENGTVVNFMWKRVGGVYGRDFTWEVSVDGEDFHNLGSGGRDSIKGDWISTFNYGFILGDNEKVTIEVDGQIYE